MLKAPSISPKVYSLTSELCDLVQSLIHKQWFSLPGQCLQCVAWMIQGSVVSEERPSGRAGLFQGQVAQEWAVIHQKQGVRSLPRCSLENLHNSSCR